MRIVIAGGHGQIALLLEKELSSSGNEVVGIIRNPAHTEDVLAAGASPLLLDLESTTADELSEHLEGFDAVVFAAGGGPNSGADRKLTVDRDAAVLLADAAERAGIRRIVVISAMSADDFDADSDDVFQIYLRAKSEADAAIRARELDWTIVRPGGLVDTEPVGHVEVGEKVARGTIPRADVAALVAHLLVDAARIRSQFEVISGDTPISEI